MSYDKVTIKYKNGSTKHYVFDMSKYEEMEKRDKLILKARKSKNIDTYNHEINIKQ